MQTIEDIQNKYKALPFLIMLYLTLMLVANVVIYKLIFIGGIIISVGSFVIPCVHVLLDIISERYGFALAKKITFYGLICQLIFATLCSYLILLPSPDFWHFQSAYDQVLGKLIRIFIGCFLGTIIGLYLNARLITKWKILVKGKYFWMRSIGSSAVGQLLFSIITLTYDMYGIQPFHTIINMILSSYTIKLIVTIIAATPAAIVVSVLNIYEKSPNFDLNINPFLSTNQKISIP